MDNKDNKGDELTFKATALPVPALPLPQENCQELIDGNDLWAWVEAETKTLRIC